jgi:hypothetical protein
MINWKQDGTNMSKELCILHRKDTLVSECSGRVGDETLTDENLQHADSRVSMRDAPCGVPASSLGRDTFASRRRHARVTQP